MRRPVPAHHREGRGVGLSPEGPIGVFDSGIGGLSILRALRAELPAEDFVYFADTAHAPYGERGDAYVAERTHSVADRLRRHHSIKALVIACNTATAAAVQQMRGEHPDLPIVGVEPALKPAVAISRTRRIGVMATRGTLTSAKFRALHELLKGQAEFLLQPCDGLADAIERGDADRIAALCRTHAGRLAPFGAAAGEVDTLVLGCTHYALAGQQLRACIGDKVALIETGQPVSAQARRILAAAGLLRNRDATGQLHLATSGEDAAVRAAAARWL